jgi:hypothetical protein
MLTYLSMAYLPIATVSVSPRDHTPIVKYSACSPECALTSHRRFQSLYSMNVLPGRATLASFFGLLAVALLLTVLLAFNMRIILSAATRSQRQAADVIRSSVRDPIGERWNSLTQSLHGDALSGSEGMQTTTRHTARDKRFLLVSMLYYLTIELPRREIFYGLSLLQRPRVPFYVKVEFSFGKLIRDLIRLLLLPLWIVLAILASFAWVVRALARQLARLVRR